MKILYALKMAIEFFFAICRSPDDTHALILTNISEEQARRMMKNAVDRENEYVDAMEKLKRGY